jgi:long-subunit fatty acid transport protein
MKNLKYLFAVAFLGQASYGFAQNEVDALRYSQTQFGGTARTLGIGGANVALGADLGSLSTNPAGLGMYQRSEFSFSPGLGLSNTETTAFGTKTSDARNSLHIGSIGFALANRRPDNDENPWRGGAFAIGLTRTNDFNQNSRYSAQPSFRQDFLQRLSEDQVEGIDDLAYDVYLTDVFKDRFNRDSVGLSSPFRDTGRLNQEESFETRGSQTQVDIGYGANYKDRLYVGGGVGIVSSRFSSTRVITATDPAPAEPNTPGTSFSSVTYRQTQDTRGAGINVRVGAIYRINDVVRVGAAIQSPTYMTLTETYGESMTATFDKSVTVQGKSYTSASSSIDPNESSYALTTPFRASGGLSAIIGKHGFISGDMEYLDYSQARLSNDNSSTATTTFDFADDNANVKQLYHSAVNVRVGGELRFDIFRLRAGYARYGDAYKKNDFDRTQNYFTGGVGIRQKSFFLDVAGVYGTNKRVYTPYFLSNAQDTPIVTVDGNRYTTTVTAGWSF